MSKIDIAKEAIGTIVLVTFLFVTAALLVTSDQVALVTR